MADLPERKIDSELDDTQGVDLDLESLFNKYILPIEKMRSFAAPPSVDRPVVADGPAVATDAPNQSSVDPSTPQESRAHAFYRMIGLPVISENSQFYNPGFDPTLKSDARKKNYDISTKVPPVVKSAHVLREDNVRRRLAVFRKISVDACIHSIAMGVPGGTKPFLQMDDNESFDFMTKDDPQKFNIPLRALYIGARYLRRDGEVITNFFDSGNHILRPFNVDPNVVDSVVGEPNKTRRVAAPFLPTKKDTGIDGSVSTLRPGIEFILRLRLSEQGTTTIADSLLSVLDDDATDTVSNSEISEVVSALLNKEGSSVSSDDIIKRLKNAHRLQLININKLVKTIKGVAEVLADSIDQIKTTSKTVRWTPVPGVKGPEEGCDITNLVYPIQKTELERRINNLQARALQSSEVGDLGDFTNSEFHLSQMENTERPWVAELEDSKECRDASIQRGSNALSAIEIITGEVSGIGLIDVLAIYTALWAIDIESLVSMLDDNAFNRLYENNENLRSFDVEFRRISGPQVGITDAVKTFEKQVINILKYADDILKDKLGTPVNKEGSDIPYDSE